MKKKIAILTIEYKNHDKIIVTNLNGDTYTSKSEELMDFLFNCDDEKLLINPKIYPDIENTSDDGRLY